MQNLTLLTDLYQLTMAASYWKEKIHEQEAVFHLFFRRLPFQGGFAVAAGLETAVSIIENFHFSDEDIEYLRELPAPGGGLLFDETFLQYLSELKLVVDVDAIPEGTLVFSNEPLMRVQGPLLHCQILESVLLNQMNFATLIATKAARLRLAAGGDTVLEFGLRRAQGSDGALTAARSAYLGGCDATSNVLAGKLYGIPVSGTMAHSYIMAHESEKAAFDSYAHAMPHNAVFLVDTYDSIEGVRQAIEVGEQLQASGHKLLGIRLDSGDLTYLSVEARKLLDQAGFHDAQIVASNELDENLVAELKRQGSQVTVWGVGTNLVTARDCPALDGVYKLSALKKADGKWEHKLKLSEQLAKITTPGRLQVRRYRADGLNLGDVIYDEGSDLSDGCVIVDPLDGTRHKSITGDTACVDLLQPIFRQGECVYTLPSLAQVRAHRSKEMEHLHQGTQRFVNPHPYVVGLEQGLHKRKLELIENIRKGHTL